MCGIWALFGGDGNVAEQCSCALKIAHRGPDSFRLESVRHFERCVLGFHRLCINDGEHGMQPMRVRRYPHLWLCCNGEIYNHKQLRDQFGFDCDTDCDCEIIIHLYEKGGVQFAAEQLDGVFAFILLDTNKKQVCFTRDTFGVRPLFSVTERDSVLAVSSEVKGLMGMFKKTKNGDVEPAIKAFPPGCYKLYDMSKEGRTTLKEHGRFHEIGDMPKYNALFKPHMTPNQDHLEAIRLLLEAAVQKRLMSERRIGCLLSGGLDSSLIAALLTKNARKAGITYPIQTYSIGMEGSPDIAAAKKVADHIGSEHHEVRLTPQDLLDAVEETIYCLESYDLITIRGSVYNYLLARYIQRETDSVVIYSGEGSDEVTHGYIYFKKAPSDEAADEEGRRLLRELYMFDVLRTDRTTAAHGLEVRVPFLDHTFTSYYLSLPMELRRARDGIEKYLLREAFSGTGLLPEEILWRPKEGFSDGVSAENNSTHMMLGNFAQSKVTDEMMANAKKTFPTNPPKTKEGYYYRQVFERYFPGKGDLMLVNWTSKWTNSDDPSARTQSNYKSS
ncbi:asparagine synthetase [glutamine-hydrolyzing]-like [Branchiostoma floridae]|uniref:Asparagine synthetase [glutamine-hydrolyzing] n=1 Tax=Branchiostoma floridae TaxID=7739 RepID=A0A9J7L5H8_BRAFL|nr:asparagine synthetase [glutamine-hydrolyzing]-like [Branchiostoma floridae]